MIYEDLISLRICLARVAQKLGIDEHIPGAKGRRGLSFDQLNDCAAHHEGWDTLCAAIIAEIDYMEAIEDEEEHI